MNNLSIDQKNKTDEPSTDLPENTENTTNNNNINNTIINNIIIINNCYPNSMADDNVSKASNDSSIIEKSSQTSLMCRICHCEETNEEHLLSPCFCSGTLRYVHQSCLQQWLKSNAIKSCELCKYDFIMSYETRPFKNWQKLEMNNIERRKVFCSVTFHAIAITCVIWSLYVLIERTAEEGRINKFNWSFWTKLIGVAIGFTGGVVFMYIQLKMYLSLCNRWKNFNRVIIIQPITEEIIKNSKKKILENQNQNKTNLNDKSLNNTKRSDKSNKNLCEEATMLIMNPIDQTNSATNQNNNNNSETVINFVI